MIGAAASSVEAVPGTQQPQHYRWETQTVRDMRQGQLQPEEWKQQTACMKDPWIRSVLIVAQAI
jgi:hypothetical protein